MVTALWRTCSESDGMWPPKFRPNWSIASYFSNIFQHGGRPPFWILIILIFDHVTIIEVVIFCCVANFIKIGSRVRPPDAHNCWMFNAPLLGATRLWSHDQRRDRNAIIIIIIIIIRQRPLPWQPHHGGHVGDMTGCDHPSFVQIGPLVDELYSISNIFKYGGRPPSCIGI